MLDVALGPCVLEVREPRVLLVLEVREPCVLLVLEVREPREVSRVLGPCVLKVLRALGDDDGVDDGVDDGDDDEESVDNLECGSLQRVSPTTRATMLALFGR